MPREAYYILGGDDGRTLVPCGAREWGEMFGQIENRRVALTELPGCRVSTVFLGLDHGFADSGPPQVFETLVFGGPLADEMWRYATWAEAEAGHARAVRRVVIGLLAQAAAEPGIRHRGH